MNEKENIPSSPSVNEQPEKLSEFLRKTREAKRITLEKMSRDTALNLEYLYALEQGNYKCLPAYAYVRIYLRAIAKYLQIDPNKIVEKFNIEFSCTPEAAPAKRPTSGMNMFVSQKRIKPFAIGVGAIILIIIVSLIRTGVDKGKYEKGITKNQNTIADKAEKPVEKKLPASIDSAESLKTVKTDSETTLSKSPELKSNMLLLTVKCDKESSWVMIYRDSSMVPWQYVLKNGQERSFWAKKQFYLSFGRISDVSIYLNKKKISIPSGKGVSRISVESKNIKAVSVNEWNKIFADTVDLNN